MDGTSLGSSYTVNSAKNLTIGSRGAETNYRFKGKVYYIKITDKSIENLIRSYIPVHNTITNSAGLYDTINNQFYPNNGTGVFTEGPEK